MQYINKQPNPSVPTRIIDNFLNSCWAATNYIGAEYANLPKQTIRQYLLTEQNNLCCYCMKSLVNDHTTTLEHIAPHHCDIAEFNKYSSPLIVLNVIHSSIFNRTSQFEAPGLYPHDIAYHNLIASCNSNSHCNHYRRDEFIADFFYDNQIEHKVEYDLNGNVLSTEYFDDLNIVGVSTNALLVLYRRVWYVLANVKQSAEEVTEEDITNVVTEMIDESNFEFIINNLEGAPSKKPELLKYKWFFSYYKNKINIIN